MPNSNAPEPAAESYKLIDGVKVYGKWAGRWLHEMSKDELCEIIVQLERRIRENSEQHLRDLDNLAGGR